MKIKNHKYILFFLSIINGILFFLSITKGILFFYPLSMEYRNIRIQRISKNKN
jgi:hypothetical protein